MNIIMKEFKKIIEEMKENEAKLSELDKIREAEPENLEIRMKWEMLCDIEFDLYVQARGKTEKLKGADKEGAEVMLRERRNKILRLLNN